LAKGLQILEYVICAPGKVRLRSIATHFNMDRSAAFRFLATLEAFEYISKDTETKAYSPGPGLVRLRRLARPRSELIELTSPFLNRISELTGQTGYLAMLENDRALLLEVTPGRGVVSVRHYVGQLEPLYCTSVGKAILAMLPAAEQNAIIRGLVLKKNTPRTIVSKRALRQQLAEIQASGVAFDECEWREEICCIGAPILDETGYPIAAVGMSMVDALVKGGPRAMKEWIKVVRDAASDAGSVLAGAFHVDGLPAPSAPLSPKLDKIPG
jgi:IclR family acetate operon transcriptional repressor